MKRWSFLISFLFLASSCHLFETEKISSEEIFKEEMGTIDWKDVDNYPTFSACKDVFEKAEQRACFIKILSGQLYKSIQQEGLVAVRDVNDTLKVNFEVTRKGKLSIREISMDSLLRREFPYLEKTLKQSIDSLQPIAPAYKRGIPVKTEFIFPIILRTN